MKARAARPAVMLVMLVAGAIGAPAWAQQVSSDGAGFTPRLDFGFVDLGVSVAPRHRGATLGTPSEMTTSLYRLADTEITTADIGLDVRFRWPAAPSAVTPTLQPYVSFGPALAVPVGEDALAMSRSTIRTEPPPTLGVRGALGLTWQLTPDASLFGEYRRVQEMPGRGFSDADVFYGVNIRFR